jgi:aminomethyltransferase
MKTALYEKHTGLNAKMIEFAGYLMPVQYEGVVAEHLCVKENVGVFDVSHMGEFYVFGDKTEEFLQSVLSNDVSALKKGQAQYNCIPNETGGIVDDLILYKLESDRFMLVVNASNIKKDWDFLNKKNVFDVQMINVSNDYSLISVQGPKSINVLQSIFDFDLNTIKYYNFIFSDGLIISNTGYTGCGGFEIYCKNEKASDLWDKIFKVGENYNIKAIGLAARDTLRLEMGFCLYGNDIDDESSPIEAGLSWITKTDKVFTSSKLFKNQKENGVSKKLIGFKMLEKAIPRKDYEILNSKNEIIGKVTSGTMSPSLSFGIGLGYVKSGFEKIDTDIYIKIRKNIKKAIIVKTPFK